MVTAIVLINVKRQAVNETAQALIEFDAVAEVYSVAGQWDLVAILRAQDNNTLAEVVTDQMLRLADIEMTTTLVAFQRAYSRHDLERMFGIGVE